LLRDINSFYFSSLKSQVEEFFYFLFLTIQVEEKMSLKEYKILFRGLRKTNIKEKFIYFVSDLI
jgi:hypothetical protein